VKGYTGGARGGFSLALLWETKLFSRTAHSALAGTNPIAAIIAAGGAMTMWHSVQLPAEHRSSWCHTIPIVVANTNTINKRETVTRQLRVRSGIAGDPIKKLLLHPYFTRSQQRRRFIEDSSCIRAAASPRDWPEEAKEPRNKNVSTINPGKAIESCKLLPEQSNWMAYGNSLLESSKKGRCRVASLWIDAKSPGRISRTAGGGNAVWADIFNRDKSQLHSTGLQPVAGAIQDPDLSFWKVSEKRDRSGVHVVEAAHTVYSFPYERRNSRGGKG
jgi:hypothetical protein